MVYIRDFIDIDLKNLIQIRNDSELQSLLMAYYKVNTTKNVKDWIRRREDENDTVFKILALEESNECIGFVQLTNIDYISSFGYMGIAIHPNFQNNGYGKEGILKFEKFLSQKSIRKLLLNVLSININAINLYKSLGYSVCGEYKEHFLLNSMYMDVLIMEKLNYD